MRIFWIALALAGGCTFDANTEVESVIEIELGKLGSDCSGDGEKTTSLGTSTWQKSSDGTTCTIVSQWGGNLVDMPVVRAKVEEELKKNGSSLEKAEVSFDAIELSFHDVFVDPAVPVEKISLAAAVGADSIDLREVATLPELKASISLSGASVAKALEAFQKSTPLLGSGKTRFSVPVAALAAGGPDAKVVVGVTTTVRSKLTIKQL